MTDDVQRIKERLDITEVVSDYVDLQQAGQYLKAKSPFTDEHNPSFYVSPEKGLYHCFSSGKGGDIFTFVQEMEGVDFREALEILADRAGITLQGGSGGGERKRLREIVATAKDFFVDQLTDSKLAKQYLEDRGITENTAKTFELGYAPDDWRQLLEHLQAAGYTTEDIIAAGLAKQPDSNKSPYDRFRNRLMFPICDTTGRPIAFSGRRLDPDDPAKYINSPETPLFRKKRVLFGYHLAKSSLRELDAAILVEGQTDLVLAYQAGCKNVVASSGTAVTKKHLELIQRFTNNLILALDTDEAGRESTLKTARLAVSEGMTPKVADLPDGFDPADVVASDGHNLQQIIADAKHVIPTAVGWAKNASSDRRSFLDQLQARVFPLLSSLDNAITRDHFVSQIADQAGVREKTLRKELDKITDSSRQLQQQTSKAPSGEVDDLLTRKERREQIEKELLQLLRWQEQADNPVVDPEELSEKVDEIKERQVRESDVSVEEDEVFATEVMHEDSEPDQIKETIRELLLNFEEVVLQQAYETAQAQIARTDDSQEKQTLLEKCQRISQRIQEIRKSVREHA